MARYRIRYYERRNLLNAESLNAEAVSAADLVAEIRARVGDLYILELEELRGSDLPDSLQPLADKHL